MVPKLGLITLFKKKKSFELLWLYKSWCIENGFLSGFVLLSFTNLSLLNFVYRQVPSEKLLDVW